MKRLFDLIEGSTLLIVFAVPMVLIGMAIKLTSPGPVLYWSDRVGRKNQIFRMPKFRSMKTDAPELATHLFPDADTYLTPIGGFLRLSSLDELPQLFSVLIGHLSLVGPRPAMSNQSDLISLRTQTGVNALMPGITGWAQINGRDHLSIPEKVRLDCAYLRAQSFWFDLRILGMTIFKVVRRDGISH